MAYLDAVQGAVLLIIAVIGTAGNGALNAGVGILVIHIFLLLIGFAYSMRHLSPVYSDFQVGFFIFSA